MPTNTFFIELPANGFDLLQFSLSAIKSLCRMFPGISQGYSNICLRHNFKQLLAFFLPIYATKSVLSVEDVSDGIPDKRAIVPPAPNLKHRQGLDSAPKMGQPSKSVNCPFQSFDPFLFVSEGQTLLSHTRPTSDLKALSSNPAKS